MITLNRQEPSFLKVGGWGGVADLPEVLDRQNAKQYTYLQNRNPYIERGSDVPLVKLL